MKTELNFEKFVEVGSYEYRINIVVKNGDFWIEKAWMQYPDRNEDLMEVDEDVISMIEGEIDLEQLVNEEYAESMAGYGKVGL